SVVGSAYGVEIGPQAPGQVRMVGVCRGYKIAADADMVLTHELDHVIDRIQETLERWLFLAAVPVERAGQGAAQDAAGFREGPDDVVTCVAGVVVQCPRVRVRDQGGRTG